MTALRAQSGAAATRSLIVVALVAVLVRVLGSSASQMVEKTD